jgi:hypothetical protein
VNDLEHRLRTVLEPILEMREPREKLSAYHDMPYALFQYDPADEFELRKQVTLLETRLTQKGKRVFRISLAECLDEAMKSQNPLDAWFTAEREQGVETVVETVHAVLAEYAPLVELVAEAHAARSRGGTRRRLHPPDRRALPRVPHLLAARAAQGARRCSDDPLLPRHLDGAAGLRFMGVLEPEHNYRPKIF